MHGRKTNLAGLMTWIVALGAGVAAPACSQTPDPRDQMNVWAGRWDDRGEIKETAYSHAAPFHKHVTCGWTGDRGYMVCEYLDVDAPPAEIGDNLSIFAYDEKAQAFRHFGIGDYRMNEEPQVSVQGDAWSYTQQKPTKSGGKVDVRATYEFLAPDKRVTRIEVSADAGQHWVLIVEEVETKVS
jgi:hypothetical protein